MVTLTLIKIDVIDFNCTNETAIHLCEVIVVYTQQMALNIGYLCYIYLLILFIYHIVHFLVVMHNGMAFIAEPSRDLIYFKPLPKIALTQLGLNTVLCRKRSNFIVVV